jgi:hypothetical protein
LLPCIAFVALYRRQWFACTFGLALLVSFTIPNTYYHVTLYLVDFVVGAGLAIPLLAVSLFRNAPARPRAVQRSRLGLDESEMPHADETAVG